MTTTARVGLTARLPAGLRSSLRLPAAAAAVVAAAAHVPVTPEHLAEVPYVGWMFVALIAGCTAGAAALVIRDAAVVWGALGSACFIAVVLYAVSRGPGLLGMTDDIGDWLNELGLVSVASESLVVVLAVAALARARLRHADPTEAQDRSLAPV